MQMLLSGFLSESYVLYDFERNDPSLYLSDMSRFARTFWINRSPHLLDDKFAFAVMLESLGYPTAPIRALAGRGQIMSSDTGRRLDATSCMELVQRHDALVIKPRFGGGGGRIRFVRVDGPGLLVNDQPTNLSDFVTMLKQSQHIVTDVIHQHAYAARVHARSTNTIRVLTMIDVENGTPFIAAAVHRFGTSASFPVDNWSKGGISAAVDLATGTLGPGVTFPMRYPRRIHACHPESGVQIVGTVIPHWPSICAGVLGIAGRLPPDTPYVGWDVIVTRDGFVVLEGNRYSDVNLLQVHGPLLADPRVRAFYRHYGAA